MHVRVFAAGAVLFLGACGVLALVGLVAWRQRRRPSGPPGHGHRPAECARLRAEADVLARHAVAAAHEAERAAARAAGAGDHAAEADRARDEAWAAYEAEHRAYGAARVAVPAPVAPPPGGPGTQVSRAALAAYRRGDLSLDELHQVWRRADGWDPVQEARAQDLERLAADARRARRAYEHASAVARARAQAAQVAGVAARALADEAVEAAAEAREARAAVDGCPQPRRR
jgi:hypothetical protein